MTSKGNTEDMSNSQRKRVCATCFFNGGLTSPPSPGGPLDGVYCKNPYMASTMDDQQEFLEKGSINLWRVEEVCLPGEDASCVRWRANMPTCSNCHCPLKEINAEVTYGLYFKDGHWHKGNEAVSYRCGGCGIEVTKHDDGVEDALRETGEL